jgi:hypothetical protein
LVRKVCCVNLDVKQNKCTDTGVKTGYTRPKKWNNVKLCCTNGPGSKKDCPSGEKLINLSSPDWY